MNLEVEALEFAQALTSLVGQVIEGARPFHAVAVPVRIRVHQQNRRGIDLKVRGREFLTLKASFECVSGRSGHLAIESSWMHVFVRSSDRQPLFRYEYERNPRSVPSAHMHVHAHRDAFTWIMARSGRSSHRSGRRASDLAAAIPSIQDLHFPLGGHRFRPGLEDVLDMLIDEFGVDHLPGAKEALAESRARWRRQQLSAAVREAPEIAAEVLADLGYTA